MVTSIDFRPLRGGELHSLGVLLWRAFESDPLFRYLFRSRWYAGRAVPLLFGATARDALAVNPDRQGQGVGSHMLAFGLRRADEAGFACRLRTSNERNLALYGRFGFEVRDETRPFRSGPPIWSMWRPATALRADAGPEPGTPEANRPVRSRGR